MRRKLLFRVGKFLQRLGHRLSGPGNKLADFGLLLWDRNCDFSKCEERRKNGTN